jgi:hypothetical protein
MKDFSMKVEEILFGPMPSLGEGELILAGPHVSGSCHVGDNLVVESSGGQPVPALCVGLELVDWGADRSDWLSVRVKPASSIQGEHMEEIFLKSQR